LGASGGPQVAIINTNNNLQAQFSSALHVGPDRGKSDILCGTATGQIDIWLMNGTAIASQGIPGCASSSWGIKFPIGSKSTHFALTAAPFPKTTSIRARPSRRRPRVVLAAARDSGVPSAKSPGLIGSFPPSSLSPAVAGNERIRNPRDEFIPKRTTIRPARPERKVQTILDIAPQQRTLYRPPLRRLRRSPSGATRGLTIEETGKVEWLTVAHSAFVSGSGIGANSYGVSLVFPRGVDLYERNRLPGWRTGFCAAG
jgi:hypothetical protein